MVLTSKFGVCIVCSWVPEICVEKSIVLCSTMFTEGNVFEECLLSVNGYTGQYRGRGTDTGDG